MQTSRCLGISLFCLLGALGCATTDPRLAVPEPRQTFGFEKVTFDGFSIDGQPEEEWLAARPEADRTAWKQDKAELTASLVENMEDEGTLFQVTPGAYPNGTVVHVNLDGFDGRFHFTVSATTGSGSVRSVRIATAPKGGGFHAAFRAFRLQGASAIALFLTSGAKDLPKNVATVEAQRAW